MNKPVRLRAAPRPALALALSMALITVAEGRPSVAAAVGNPVGTQEAALAQAGQQTGDRPRGQAPLPGAGAEALQAAEAQGAASYEAWFRLGPPAFDGWSVGAVESDPLRVTIRPRGDVGAPAHRITVLYPRASSAYDVAMTKILEVFEEKALNAEFTVINYQNLDERGDEALQDAIADDQQLILAMGSESAAWLWENYRDGAIPVVSVCAKDPVLLGQASSYDRGTGTNFAFTSLNMPIETQMAYVLELKPSLKNIAVLVDRGNVSAMQTQALPIEDYARQRGIRAIEVGVEGADVEQQLREQVTAAVAAMRKNDPTLEHSVFWITGSTRVFKEIATINAVADRVPVLSAVPEIVKAGDESALLSIGISFESNAHLAAIYAADILLGRSAVGDLKVGIISPADIVINFRKAREIGLRIPFSFFESASSIYDYEGNSVRVNGKSARHAGS